MRRICPFTGLIPALLFTVPALSQTPSVLTWHNDNMRSGQNLHEYALTPQNVNSSSFGKVLFLQTDGKVDGQPLYVPGLKIRGYVYNALFVVTEHDSVYAFDADTGNGLWAVTILRPGETTADNGCSQISPEIGITSTPVIDLRQGPNGAIFVVGMTKDSSGKYHQRLKALDLATGSELPGGPVDVQATYPGTGDNHVGNNVVFDPKQYAERAGLLELNGVIYTAWTSHCDERPYTGWIIGYNASNLQPTSVLNLTPNGSEGSIWMSGAGIAATATRMFLLDANGTFDTTLDANGFPAHGDFGNTFLTITPTNGKLEVKDYYAIGNTVQESDSDTDLGSGGTVLLPDLRDENGNVHLLAVGAGKDSNIYVVDRDNMGKYRPEGGNIYQVLTKSLPNGVWASPAYFNNTVYYGGNGDYIKAFKIVNAKLVAPAAQHSAEVFGYPGATPALSANGETNAILWAVENSNPAVLHAYNAADLSQELYNSNQAGKRDQFGNGNKFIVPTIANGRVYVGTQTGVAVFGLLQK